MLLQATPLRSTHSTESIVIESNDEEQIVQFHWKEVVIKIKVRFEREREGVDCPICSVKGFCRIIINILFSLV